VPKWVHYREAAKILGIKLSDDIMSKIDRASFLRLIELLEELKAYYGGEAVRYALLHIFLDKAKIEISSELGKKRGLNHPDLAGNVGFLTALSHLKQLKEQIPLTFYVDLDWLLETLESNSNTLIQYISSLPEVESKISTMRRFGSKSTQYSEIAKQYIRQFNLTSNYVPTLINFMMELNSMKYSGSKEEHALKVLEKYKTMYSKGWSEKARRKLYDCFEKLAQDWVEGKL
jgi:hypothetical protein